MAKEELNTVEEEVTVADEEETVETTEEATVEVEQPEDKGFDGLFADEKKGVAFGGNNQLNKTARLTAIAEDVSRQVFEKATSGDEGDYSVKIKASQQSHDAMDDLINELFDLGTIDVDFLKSESEETLEKMIRSQQSKRSRAKSKHMTRENYSVMMVGAVAENLLRMAADKPKTSGGGAVMRDIGFSAEDLEKLADFPEDLKKAIRNVQSKKSIMKSKADFDIQNPRYQQLLRAEQQLKDVRDEATGKANETARKALEAKEKANELLGDINLDELPPEEASKLLSEVKNMLASM